MVVYAVIMFLVAALFSVMGILIYRGKTELIHDYHQTKVKDKAAYGKAFGKALLVFAGAMLASGVIALLSDSAVCVIAAVCVLILGMVIGGGCVVVVQQKYNQGIF